MLSIYAVEPGRIKAGWQPTSEELWCLGQPTEGFSFWEDHGEGDDDETRFLRKLAGTPFSALVPSKGNDLFILASFALLKRDQVSKVLGEWDGSPWALYGWDGPMDELMRILREIQEEGMEALIVKE